MFAKYRTYHCKQIPLQDKKSPLIPPDIMIDNYGMEYSPHDAKDARFEYSKAIKSRNTNGRKYLKGSKYKKIYEETYNEIINDDCKLVINIEDGTTTEINIKTFESNHELVEPIKEFCIKYFKNRRVGNCRITSGDAGIMNVIGYNANLKRQYNINNDIKEDVGRVSEIASNFYKIHFENEARSMMNKSCGKERVNGMNNSIVSEYLVSKDLINAAHYDTFDISMSIALWVEEIKGDAKGWKFILPNVTLDGEKGTVIPLSHGKIISWDGTKIYHCSTVREQSDENNVYGFFWSKINI